jgi:hypothetical protein
MSRYEEPLWCWGCGDSRTVGANSRSTDDPTLCRRCNNDRYEEAAQWIDDEDMHQ